MSTRYTIVTSEGTYRVNTTRAVVITVKSLEADGVKVIKVTKQNKVKRGAK